MQTLHQSPRDMSFVQDPYRLYARVLDGDPVRYWADHGCMAVFGAPEIEALLRDRRLGRARPPGKAATFPAHLSTFARVERVSLLELEPPAHTRLRGLVLRAFTSASLDGLAPQIEAVAAELIGGFPEGPFDLIARFCTPLPARIIARLLGVPEALWPELLRWSHAMVAMYQSRRDRSVEVAAEAATRDFIAFLEKLVGSRRAAPRNDLISRLVQAERDNAQLSRDELLGTCILLLNAGHEATVHTLGNAVKTLLETGTETRFLSGDAIASTVEELLRFDPPLHVFMRHAYENVRINDHLLEKGRSVALILGAAGRDPRRLTDPARFDPARPAPTHAAFGGGIHFCLGAALARMEMRIGLAALFHQVPNLRLVEVPRYADSYHFHGLERLMVTT